MIGSDFLNALVKAMPSHAELEEYGLSEDEIKSIQAAFQSTAREGSTLPSVAKSELEKMLLEYDCSTVEIGLIRFLPEPRTYQGVTIVAYCEADLIAVSEADAIVMHDHDDFGRTTACAKNSEAFLDALTEWITLRRNASQWKERSEEAAKRCAEKAGGLEYLPFFRILC